MLDQAITPIMSGGIELRHRSFEQAAPDKDADARQRAASQPRHLITIAKIQLEQRTFQNARVTGHLRQDIHVNSGLF
jgi:hypothetical protein